MASYLLHGKTWDPALPMNTNGNGDWRSDTIYVYLPDKSESKSRKIVTQSAFYQNTIPNYFPIAKKQQSDFNPENGWVLFYEELGRPGWTISTPRFSLYNRYTGLLRTFFYVHEYNQDYTFALSQLTASQNSYSFSLAEEYSYIFAADKKSMFNGNNSQSTLSFPMMPNSFGRQWIWSEFPILYDTNQLSANDLSQWTFNLKGISQAIVNLQANIENGIGTTTTGQKKSGIGSVFQAGKKTIGCFKEGLDWKKQTLDFLKDPNTPFYNWLNKEGVGKSLNQFTGKIASILPYANAIIGLFSFMTSGGGDGNSTESAIAAMLSNLSFSGDITYKNAIGDELILREPSNFEQSTSYTGNMALYNKPLGIFNLKTTPVAEFRNCKYYNSCVENYPAYAYICSYLRSRSFKLKTAPNFAVNPTSGLNQTLSNIEGAIQYKITWNDVYTCNGTWNGPPGSSNNPNAYWAPGTINMMRTIATQQWAAENNLKIVADCNGFTIVQSDFLPWSKLENTVFDLPVAWGYDVTLKVKAIMNVAGKPNKEPVVFVADYKVDEVCVSGTDYFNSSSNLTSLPVMGRVDAIGDNCPLIKIQIVESQTNNVYEIYTDNSGQYSCSLPKNKIYIASYYIVSGKGEEKVALNTFVVKDQNLNTKGVIEIEPITMHTMKKAYNWVSFPSIGDRMGYVDDLVDYCQILKELKPVPPKPWGATGNFAANSFNGQTLWDMGGTPVANIQSSKSYKIKTLPVTTRRMITSGPYLDPKLKVMLYKGRSNWLGCWIPGIQNFDKAFGSNFSKVSSIQSENWMYSKQIISPDKGVDPFEETPMPSTKIRPLEFGKGYIVTVKEDFELQWNVEGTCTKDTIVYSKPEAFEPEEKADYTVIDAMDIPPEVKEIGVFVEEKCVGAVVVDEPAEQILIYRDSVETKGHYPYTFKVITENSKTVEVKAYKVFDFETNNYFNAPRYHGDHDYSIVSFKKDGSETVLLPTITTLEQNYPNPFNPLTQIKYSLSEQADVKIKIYNVLGNEVATLYNGKQIAGWHKVDFDGTRLSSGLYFYNLQVNGKKFSSKKMMLMK